MSSSSSSPHVVEDCLGLLRILSDGTILRSPDPPSPNPIRDDGTVEWKDLQFHSSHNLHLRLYKPRDHHRSKLPLFFFFHGGGFCIGSRTWPNFHNCCLRLSSHLRAIVVAPDYRLAPEHRLPAAIDDAVSAVDWIHTHATSADPDPWLASDVADFGRVFISGESAGGNIVHHLAVRFGSTGGLADSGPVRIRGYVLLMPFFAGNQLTKSEAECPKDAFFNLEINMMLWRVSLPRGADADHPVANPFGPGGPSLESAGIGPMLVVVGGCDLLRDRDVEYARRLEGWGKPVELVEFSGQQHGFFSADCWSEPADELMGVVKRFVDVNGSGSN